MKQLVNRLLMLRANGLTGPLFQRVTSLVRAHSAGPYLGTVGGVSRALRGVIEDDTSLTITFSDCVLIDDEVGFEYQIGDGAWTAFVAAPTGSGTTWDFTVPETIPDLTQVRWRMAEGAATSCDLEDPVDVPTATLLMGNVLVLDELILLEDLDGYVLDENGEYILLEG